MVSVVGIRNSFQSFGELKEKLGLSRSQNPNFFREWDTDLPEHRAEQKTVLDKLHSRYNSYREETSLLEGTINLYLIAPLLELAGFLDAPFRVKSPEPVSFTLSNADGVEYKGWIDVLVVKNNLWVLVIESKRDNINVRSAFPQILAYMMANPMESVTYGCVTNGDDFIFTKLDPQLKEYDFSDPIPVLSSRNRLGEVLAILLKLGSCGEDR